MPRHRTPLSHQNALGFTVIEAMIVLAVTAIIFTQALPSFWQMYENNQLSVQKNRFISAMQLTRSESIKRNRPVWLCVNDEQPCVGSPDWSKGWLVYDDKNENGHVDKDELIQLFEPLPKHYRLNTNANVPGLKYLASGYPRRSNGALPLVTFLMCGPDTQHNQNIDDAYTITVNASGRARVRKGTNGTVKCLN